MINTICISTMLHHDSCKNFQGRFPRRIELSIIFNNSNSIPIHLICKQNISVIKQNIINRHYDTFYGKMYDIFVEILRDKIFVFKFKRHGMKEDMSSLKSSSKIKIITEL